MSEDILQQVRDLQFNDRSGAEALLRSFVRDELGLDVVKLELTPLAVSLNSFNGFLTLKDGKRLFFKSHTESDTVINEYYNAGLLADAGYPIIQPVFRSTEPGKQFLAYDVIADKSVFDVAWELENQPNSALLSGLTHAQHRADDDLFKIYQRTLTAQKPDTIAAAPIHQLFYHRLVGGRLDRFYAPHNEIRLPGITLPMSTVLGAKWQINGQHYTDTLSDIIERATRLLEPGRLTWAVVGHGDAHNGNVFYRSDDTPPSLLYFDPAFAGRHSPLLDIVKPLFHNVFAMWMYYPQEKSASTPINVHYDGSRFDVTYDYALPIHRHMFLMSKIDRVLVPVLGLMQQRGIMPDDWRATLKSALFCCPFLTMNLSDNERFPPEIALLGLAMSVEMGAESQQTRSLIDTILDDVAQRSGV